MFCDIAIPRVIIKVSFTLHCNNFSCYNSHASLSDHSCLFTALFLLHLILFRYMLFIMIRFPLLKDVACRHFNCHIILVIIFLLWNICIFWSNLHRTHKKWCLSLFEVLLRFCSHLLRKSFRENLSFCTMLAALHNFKFINKQARTISDFS